MNFAAMMLVALTLDIAIGWPHAIFRRIGHPVTWIGALIACLETRLNKPGRPNIARRRAGALACVVTVAAATLPATVLAATLPENWLGVLAGGLLAWPFIAARSLYTHVRAVAVPLETGDLATSRHAVAQIVGRDPKRLDEAGIARASLESLAENTSDGVIAPLFWGALLGLPGLVAYKAANTLDSMIGHKTDRYRDFGRFAARFDDLVNLVPARVSGLLIGAVSGHVSQAFSIMWRDAPRHRSPNAGWPEAALAAALRIRLSGPRSYDDRVADEPWLNSTDPDPTPQDIKRGLVIYCRTMVLTASVLGALALIR